MKSVEIAVPTRRVESVAPRTRALPAWGDYAANRLCSLDRIIRRDKIQASQEIMGQL